MSHSNNDIDSLVDQLSSANIFQDEEYQLLLQGHNSKVTDSNISYVLYIATNRYKRYIAQVDWTSYPDIEANIYRFLQLDVKTNFKSAFDLMHLIDSMILELLANQNFEETNSDTSDTDTDNESDTMSLD
jgi:hypothetical protein